jgi:uncharacterized protein (TIGR03437 family)
MTSLRIAAAAAILFAAGVQAGTLNTTLTVTNATVASSGTSFTVSGPCALTGIGSGTISSTLAIGTSISGPYTITVTGGTITGTVTIPTTVLTGTSGSGSATVTGGTGTYAGATGSFPSLSGTLNASSFTLSLTGAGTITAAGVASGGTATPSITGVLDAGSYTSGVAQGSVFVVKGTNLSPSGFTQLSFPLPTSSGGVSINFTPFTGGTATPAYLDYLYNQSGVNQLAAILPSTVAPGNYNVTVTAGGATSAPFVVQVTQRKPELITADSTGNGLAVMQNYISASQLDVNRFTVGTVGGFTISPARPGQTEIAYSVGMGPDPGQDNLASSGYNFLANGVTVNVLVGSQTIPATYAGRVAGGSGYEQINFVLPANTPTGCTVPFQISVNGTLSNSTFMAIAPDATSNACVQAGYSTSDLQKFDNGAVTYVGGFSLQQFSTTVPGTGAVSFTTASGAFTKYTGFELSGIPPAITTLIANLNGCVVTQGNGSTGTANGVGINLDAGTITLSGPAASSLANQAFTETSNTYSIPTLSLNTKLVAGTYTLSGAGGTDVGKISASVTIPSPLTVTGGLPANVVRGAGLNLAWTGGNSGDLVEVIGSSGTLDASGNQTTGATFICITTAGQGGINVSSLVLNQLPAATASAIAGHTAQGSLGVFSFVNPTAGNGLFTAPLTAGGSINSTFTGLVGTASQPSYQ